MSLGKMAVRCSKLYSSTVFIFVRQFSGERLRQSMAFPGKEIESAMR